MTVAKRSHKFFEVGVKLKGAHACLEIIAGLLLAFVSTSAITRVATSLTQSELSKRPHDVVAQYLLARAHELSVSSQTFGAFYLLSHGIVKIALVIALLRDKLWAYPASLAVLGLFMIYQVYRFTLTHSLGLVALTIFDIVVLALIWHEYLIVRRQRSKRGADASNASKRANDDSGAR